MAHSITWVISAYRGVDLLDRCVMGQDTLYTLKLFRNLFYL